ncbi:MAG: hypothetical protein QOF52_280, partial [Propionibacteriaceae bacterium]|nr:hypothetical protein [Propionibacteriaceae bacterium]
MSSNSRRLMVVSITHPFTSVAHHTTPMDDATQSADLPRAQLNAA